MEAKEAPIRGWWVCSSCGSYCATKVGAEECCRGRHSRKEKEVYKPVNKKPGAWV